MTRPSGGEEAEQLELMQNCTEYLENGLAVSYKSKHALIMLSSNPILSWLPRRNKNMCSHKNQPTHVYSRFIDNFPSWKQPRCTVLVEWMNKLVHPSSGIRFSNNKLWKHSITSMNLTHIMLSGWNQSQKAACCMITNVGSRVKDLVPIK